MVVKKSQTQLKLKMLVHFAPAFEPHDVRTLHMHSYSRLQELRVYLSDTILLQ